ncbi:hypothetical protein O181_030378 [Austropuccinia psidii MF-1]|uniref:Uncharacterized protein n=1 Tax=Austropuccinia psidii MF-1 TaxID=1389203 RepID=A0A9Q3CXM3_9BASI|nr:hypothetical protein [Austropuccinia psidii MF-1]
MVKIPSLPSFEWEFLVIDNPKGEDLILGFEFLNHFNTSIDWRQGMITFNAYHNDYYDPSKSSSNYLSSSKSFEDEVFKDIQDVREDNFVSSLHLLGMWTFLIHIIMTPWESCGMKRKIRKK